MILHFFIGQAAVAALKVKRNSICVEKDVTIAKQRLASTTSH